MDILKSGGAEVAAINFGTRVRRARVRFMTATMRVEIVSAEETVFEGQAQFVSVPGVEGELGIYPRHVPLLTTIRAGAVQIKLQSNEEKWLAVSGGILEVLSDKVTILSDTCLRSEELDKERAELSKRRAEENLKKATDDRSTLIARIALQQAIAELATIEKLKKRVH